MKLYFLRHAEALDGPDDAIRPLSQRGRQQSRRLAHLLLEAGIVFDAAFTSPLVRAGETAELVLAVTNKAARVKLTLADALLNDTSPADFDRWLAALPARANILLVGHEPSLSQRVRRLLGLKRPGALELPKAGLVCLERAAGQDAALKFFLTPKSLGF